jgi:hypothetical protein
MTRVAEGLRGVPIFIKNSKSERWKYYHVSSSRLLAKVFAFDDKNLEAGRRGTQINYITICFF